MPDLKLDYGKKFYTFRNCENNMCIAENPLSKRKLEEYMEKSEQIAKEISEIGGTVTGSVVGAAIGTVIAGPLGAAGGAIAGGIIEKVFRWAGEEISERLLSKRENMRVKTVLDQAQEKIEKNFSDNKMLRDDKFFNEGIDDRSTAEEILEGTLLVAQKEYEEKKLIYLANLYANIAFDKTINCQMADRLLKIVSELTYRQLMILKVIGFFQTNPIAPARRTTAFNKISGLNNVSLASDIFDLYQRSVLFSNNAILDAAGINPSVLSIGGYGALLYNLMELANIPNDELTFEIITFLVDVKNVTPINI